MAAFLVVLVAPGARGDYHSFKRRAFHDVMQAQDAELNMALAQIDGRGFLQRLFDLALEEARTTSGPALDPDQVRYRMQEFYKTEFPFGQAFPPKWGPIEAAPDGELRCVLRFHPPVLYVSRNITEAVLAVRPRTGEIYVKSTR